MDIANLVENVGAYAGIIAAALLLFERIAEHTETDVDNKIVKIINKVFKALAGKKVNKPAE